LPVPCHAMSEAEGVLEMIVSEKCSFIIKYKRLFGKTQKETAADRDGFRNNDYLK